MNERIQELAEHAGFYSSEYYNAEENFIRFAKLIVRECVNVALEQKNSVEDQEVFNPVDEQWNRARIRQSQRIVDKIKQHFGV